MCGWDHASHGASFICPDSTIGTSISQVFLPWQYSSMRDPSPFPFCSLIAPSLPHPYAPCSGFRLANRNASPIFALRLNHGITSRSAMLPLFIIAFSNQNERSITNQGRQCIPRSIRLQHLTIVSVTVVLHYARFHDVVQLLAPGPSLLTPAREP